MRAFVFAFTIAAVTSALLTPLVRIIAWKLGAVSRPGGRNINDRTVPRLGGVAIALAFLVALAALFFAESAVAVALRTEWRKLLGLAVGASFMSAVGALDDTRRVSASWKFLAQLISASIVYTAGFRLDEISLPLVGPLSMGVFGFPVTVLWVVGIVNAINLIDGLDGLAAGVVFFAGITNFVVANVSHDTFVGALMATMLGAVLGFLFFNFNPARIFMGDSGSYFLGFILGTVSVVGSPQKASTAVSILVPILALGLPIFDTLFAMARRVLERRPIFSPDRGHVHHRLLDMGLTHRRAVLLLYGVSVIFTVTAIGVSLGRRWQVGVAILIASTVLIGLVRFVGYFEYLFLIRRQRARLRNGDTEALRRALPQALARFATALTEDDIWSRLEELIPLAQLSAVELVKKGQSDGTRAWTQPPSMETEGMVSTRFPLGESNYARAELRFRWNSTSGDVSPQTEVLLQVLVDGVVLALTRVGSVFAPVAPVERKSVERLSSPQPLQIET